MYLPKLRLQFAAAGSGVQPDVLVVDGPPQPLREDVVDGPAAAVHGDGTPWDSSIELNAELVNCEP